jgi:hypothetical protein
VRSTHLRPFVLSLVYLPYGVLEIVSEIDHWKYGKAREWASIIYQLSCSSNPRASNIVVLSKRWSTCLANEKLTLILFPNLELTTISAVLLF